MSISRYGWCESSKGEVNIHSVLMTAIRRQALPACRKILVMVLKHVSKTSGSTGVLCGFIFSIVHSTASLHRNKLIFYILKTKAVWQGTWITDFTANHNALHAFGYNALHWVNILGFHLLCIISRGKNWHENIYSHSLYFLELFNVPNWTAAKIRSSF